MNAKHALGSVAALFVVAGIASLSQGESNQNTTTGGAEEAVLSRLAEIQKAAEGLDPDKVFSFVAENNRGALAQNGRLFLTREEALASTRAGFQRLRKVEYQFDQQQVTLLSPTVALAVGEGSSTAATDDGRTITTRFAQSVLLVLTNGQWTVFHAHRSFQPAPRDK